MSAASQRTRVDTRPGRTGVIIALSAVVCLLAGFLVVKGISTIRTSREGRSAVGIVEQRRMPATPAHLVALVDRTGVPVSFLVVAPSATAGGTLLLVPATARMDTKTPGQPNRLADTLLRSNWNDQVTAVARYLGIEFASAAQADEATLTALLEPYGPTEVVLTDPVIDTDNNRSDRIIQPAGRDSQPAARIAQMLLARSDSEPESTRMVRSEVIWNTVGFKATGKPVIEAPAGTAAALLNPVLHGPLTVYRFATTRVTDPARNATGREMVDVDIADIRLVMAEVLPGAVSVAANAVRVEIQDPFHDEVLRRDAVVLLTFLGAYVVYIHDSVEPPPAKTTVQYETLATRPAADFLVSAMGAQPALAAPKPLENVDATVILGSDLQAEKAARIATSTTAATTVAVSTKP